jgi:hypothetical protein
VVIHDRDVPRRSFSPFKADPPLVVDAEARLPAAIPVQSFEAIARWGMQVVELLRRIYDKELCFARLCIWLGKALTNIQQTPLPFVCQRSF